MQGQHDVIVVGASIAGCTAAILFGRQGLRVALIERHASAAHYKKLCTHFIQPSATPTLQRLGLAERIDAAGGVHNSVDFWTPDWGWQRDAGIPSPYSQYGYSIRREVLDPMLREEARNTAGVEFLAGTTAERLIEEQGRIAGVVVSGDQGQSELRARLLVAADGRHSRLAEMAKVPTRRTPHNRFVYFAIYRGLAFPEANRSKLWFPLPAVAYAFPNDAGTMVVVYATHKDQHAEWKADPEATLLKHFEALPEAPNLRAAERVSPTYGMTDFTNIRRHAAHRGMALVGDAAQASDPVWGVGCGWALQTAEWLVECTAPALAAGGDLDAALDQYRKRHRARLAAHEFLISDFATARPFNPIEKLLFSAATRDRGIAQHVLLFAGRQISVFQFLSPGALLRAMWVNLRHWLGGRRTAQAQAA
jgi:menaquinone-9 beta-reductase